MQFVHSGSVYTFKKYPDWLEVAETTGAFKPGTRTSDVTLYERPGNAQRLRARGMVNAAFVELVTIISRNWLAIEMRVSYAVADARFPNRADALPTWTHFSERVP